MAAAIQRTKVTRTTTTKKTYDEKNDFYHEYHAPHAGCDDARLLQQ